MEILWLILQALWHSFAAIWSISLGILGFMTAFNSRVRAAVANAIIVALEELRIIKREEQ